MSTSKHQQIREWLIKTDDLVRGPFTKQTISEMLKDGRLFPQETMARLSDQLCWFAITSYEEFAEWSTEDDTHSSLVQSDDEEGGTTETDTVVVRSTQRACTTTQVLRYLCWIFILLIGILSLWLWWMA